MEIVTYWTPSSLRHLMVCSKDYSSSGLVFSYTDIFQVVSIILDFSGFSDLVENSSSNHVSEMVAYDKNGLKITFTLKPFVETPNTTVVSIEARNNTTLPISEFLFQVAVPKASELRFQIFRSCESAARNLILSF